MTVDEFDLPAFIAMMVDLGWGGDIEWAENIKPPQHADEYAREVIFVICNSGMKNTIAQKIFERVMEAIARRETARSVFGHPGKAASIDEVWAGRHISYRAFMDTAEAGRLEFLARIPWIGKITKYHLAKNFGLQCAKPDVHLQRLGNTFGLTPQALCERLALRSAFKVATIDTLLWRAAANRLLDTRTGAFEAKAAA